MKLSISKEFSTTPGGRRKTDGTHSGEEFRDDFLRPALHKAIANNEKLIIDLDGGYGYSTSFLEEAFGGLARIEGIDKVVDVIGIVSHDEPGLEKDIVRYIKEANRKK